MAKTKTTTAAHPGFEDKLWAAADKLRVFHPSFNMKDWGYSFAGTYHVLTPGRYVGAEEIEEDSVPLEEKMAELSVKIYEQMVEADEIDVAIRRNLEVLGYGK